MRECCDAENRRDVRGQREREWERDREGERERERERQSRLDPQDDKWPWIILAFINVANIPVR